MSITFSPTGQGTRAGSVTSLDNAATSPQLIALTGVGSVGPAVSLSPASLDFPNQLVNTVSPPQTIAITNTGGAVLTITSVTLTGAQFLLSNNCKSTLAAGATCTLQVSFSPKAVGAQTGTVTIADNAPGSPQTVSATGKGTVVSFSPASLNFGGVKVGQAIAPISITLMNNGPSKALSIEPQHLRR